MVQRGVKLVVCFSGKRKSGKDYVSGKLLERLRKDYAAQLAGISWSLKDEFAEIEKVDKEELRTDGPFKEVYRKHMVEFGERKRNEDPSYFCRAAMSSLDLSTSIAIITDCRRPSDLAYFGSQGYRRITVRVQAPLEVREQRGFKFTQGIDDSDTECALDEWPHPWDFVIDNVGNSRSLEESLQRLISEIGRFVEKV
ncbi:hypothetical protein QR680_004939 [Steinernema hermaphroditum]|uniref:Phosphomevalonate kinase n=1 Tax=Steinernema hermaphroditum TaxID=289476 RepID=A0AA39HQC0_9BILA|nr:hypothetical protein QR680_004939 [Steinernema hermaphroditum]